MSKNRTLKAVAGFGVIGFLAFPYSAAADDTPECNVGGAVGTTECGAGSSATDESATAVGDQAQATGLGSSAVGAEASATGLGSQAFGYQSISSGNFTLATGYQAISSEIGRAHV